jgi:predicted CXXCH cytochrome family protein
MARHTDRRLLSGFPGAVVIGTTSLAIFGSLLAVAVADDSKPAEDEKRAEAVKSVDSAKPTEAVEQSADRESAILSGLKGSKHDFSQTAEGPRDMCLPCHAPHLPIGAVGAEESERPKSLRQYQSLDNQLSNASLLCLSCHDGVVAPDVYTATHATGLAHQLGSSLVGGAGLRGHPVGILYPVGDANYQPASRVEADGHVLLPGGRIQCTTCHDPHNGGRHSGLLTRSNERSALCLTCHRL